MKEREMAYPSLNNILPEAPIVCGHGNCANWDRVPQLKVLNKILFAMAMYNWKEIWNTVFLLPIFQEPK